MVDEGEKQFRDVPEQYSGYWVPATLTGPYNNEMLLLKVSQDCEYYLVVAGLGLRWSKQPAGTET